MIILMINVTSLHCLSAKCLAKQISCSIKLVVFVKFKCVLSGRDFFSSPRWRSKYDQNVNYLRNLLCIQSSSSSSSSVMRIINIFTSSLLCESMGGFLPHGTNNTSGGILMPSGNDQNSDRNNYHNKDQNSDQDNDSQDKNQDNDYQENIMKIMYTHGNCNV